ncbi:hypothetical protein K1719_006301 [Acacia pycnantha]|nr:hypothetical protein K1719_006301 [Acacia pycnantha]
MCIELDLTKPFVPEFEVEGQTLSIVYESLGLLCTKCGMFGHAKNGCEDFQRRKSEMRVEVEKLGDKPRDDEEAVGGRDRWQTVQRPRRLRTFDNIQRAAQSGSRFAVLEEETVVEGVQKDPVGKGNPVNIQEEVRDKEPKKQDKKYSVGDGKMNSRGSKAKNVNFEEQKGKLATEGKVKVPYQGKMSDERRPLKEVQQVQKRATCETETKLEMYRNRGVEVCEKENLHPGELLSEVKCNADMELDTTRNEGENEDMGVCSGMAYGKEYATLELANDQRHDLWEDLQRISEVVNEPGLLGGDFNEIKSPLEQKGGGRVNETRCRRFNDWIQDCKLLDIEANGPLFTWRGPKWDGLDRVFKRLDRCLCNSLWQETF